ncbi:Uncharacterized protein GBIM_00134 [Gryllus bimaculatus]|nr:Uncharacterized protein GBIM_00134 [Gryllus bimaculatus]
MLHLCEAYLCIQLLILDAWQYQVKLVPERDRWCAGVAGVLAVLVALEQASAQKVCPQCACPAIYDPVCAFNKVTRRYRGFSSRCEMDCTNKCRQNRSNCSILLTYSTILQDLIKCSKLKLFPEGNTNAIYFIISHSFNEINCFKYFPSLL